MFIDIMYCRVWIKNMISAWKNTYKPDKHINKYSLEYFQVSGILLYQLFWFPSFLFQFEFLTFVYFLLKMNIQDLPILVSFTQLFYGSF